jgi:phenylacetate-CoA ligase
MNVAEWKQGIERFSAGQMTAAEIRAWQTTALQTVLQHVQSKSRFYARRLQGVDVTQVTLDNLSALPYTTKADLCDAMFDIVCGDIRDSLYFFSTTGTTGRPTPCPRAAIDVELNNVSTAFTLRRIIDDCFDPGHKPILAVLCPNELHSVCMNMSFVAKELDICKFDVFPLSPVIGFERLFQIFLELKVDMVMCSPGLMMALAEMAHAYGIDVKEDLFIRCVLCTGELCSPSMAQLIGDTWNARAYNFMYGSQEAGCISVTDPKGQLVPLMTNYIFEVIDLTTDQSLGPVVNDGYGELCLTTLVPGMKPLIRYRTGDLARIGRDAAGNPIIDILGRVKDMVRISGKHWSASEIDSAVLADHGSIYSYQLELTQTDGNDTVVLRVKPKEDADPEEARRAVAVRVREALGLDCKVELLPLLDMTTATGGWVSWKSARVKDRRIDQSNDIETKSAAALAKAAEERI